ncbi:hypothetical protein [Aliarcobacter cryaerophilus]|uniref:hypothetical protein n=1 Tax=Aliarcobacter cryaerophilus TaxID=28198 RepID=UPI003DA27ACD
MGFFKNIGDMFNGKARERHDYIYENLLETLQYKNYITILRNSNNFDGDQKLVVFLILYGYIEIATQNYEMSNNGNRDINDIQDKAHIITKYFFKDYLKWPSSHVDKVERDIKNLAYNSPTNVSNIMKIGQAIAFNMVANKASASILGFEPSKEEGYRVLDDAFNMLGFK